MDRNEPHFANTHLVVTDKDGKTHEFHAGDVVRRKGSNHAFADCVICGISQEMPPIGHGKPDMYVRLHRPIAYAHLTGTTCANSVITTEKIEVSVADLMEHFEKCDEGGHYTLNPAPRPDLDSEHVTFAL